MSSKNQKSNWKVSFYRGWSAVRRHSGLLRPANQTGMGATTQNLGTTFRVWAPHARRVTVSGDFNDWSRERDPLISEKNGYWSATIPRAREGDQYKFVIHNGASSLMRNDPYAREINKQANLRTMHQANFLYSMDHEGYTCPVVDARDVWNDRNWRDLLAPYAAQVSSNRGDANDEAIFIDPFYEDYDPSEPSSTGYAMNAHPGLPDLTRVNAFWKNGAGNPMLYMLDMIDFASSRLHIGDARDGWFFTKPNFEQVIDTTRHDGKGMFLMYDGSTKMLDREQARLAHGNPAEAGVR